LVRSGCKKQCLKLTDDEKLFHFMSLLFAVVQEMQDLTRTVKKQRMSEESRHFFETGPLKYEIEFYNFARKLFNAKLKKISISSKQKRR